MFDINSNKKKFVIAKNYSNNGITELSKLREFETYEDSHRTDIFNFDYKDLHDILLEKYNGISPNSLEVKLSVLKQYFTWAEGEPGLRTNKSFKFNTVLEVVKDELYDKNMSSKTEKMITVEDVIRKSNDLKIKQNAAILCLLFEGVHGAEFCEILNLKRTDIEGNILHLCTGRSITVSSNTITILKQADEEITYPVINRHKTNRPLISDTIIKKMKTKTSHDDNKVSKSIINRSMDNLKKNFSNKINTTSIIDSGKCYYISLIESKKGKEFRNSDYRRVQIRFGQTVDKAETTGFKYLYDNYKYKFNPNVEINTELNVIYNEMMAYEIKTLDDDNSDDKDKEDSNPDADLGKKGEDIIEKYLNTKGKAINKTNDKVGYDLLYINNSKNYKHIEVKSTRHLNSKVQFFMTKHEIDTAFKEGNNYYLYIVYFIEDTTKSLFRIKNPLQNLNLINKIRDSNRLYDDNIITPIEFRLNIDFNIVKQYQDNKFGVFIKTLI